jgi:hypothetical protein
MTLLIVIAVIIAVASFARRPATPWKPINGWKPLAVDAMGTLRYDGPAWRSLTLAADHDPSAAIFAHVALWGCVTEYQYGYRAEHSSIRSVKARRPADAEWVEKLCAEQFLPYAGVLAWHQRLWLDLREKLAERELGQTA